MTYDNMCYWVMGFLEIANPKEITKEQLTIIRNHLNLTMKTMKEPAVSEGFFSHLKPGQRC